MAGPWQSFVGIGQPLGGTLLDTVGDFTDMHTEQFYVTFLMSLFRLLFSGHCLPELLTKAKSLSSEECADVWWSFVAISLFDFSSVDIKTLR